MRTVRSRLTFPLALVATLALSLTAPACSDEASATAGKRISLETRLEAGPEATSPFTNAAGWTITLTKASIATGAFYYFDGAVILSSRSLPQGARARAAFASLWGVGVAHAHPGHYLPGDSRGQMLTAYSADLRAGAANLPAGDGITGFVRSATFSFAAPATGPLANELGDHVAVLEGRATKGAEVRVFRAEIDAGDLANAKGQPSVEGCPFRPVEMKSDGVVTVRVSLAQWFDQVELDAVPSSVDGAPVLLQSASIAHNELVRGMKSGNAYNFSYATR